MRNSGALALSAGDIKAGEAFRRSNDSHTSGLRQTALTARRTHPTTHVTPHSCEAANGWPLSSFCLQRQCAACFMAHCPSQSGAVSPRLQAARSAMPSRTFPLGVAWAVHDPQASAMLSRCFGEPEEFRSRGIFPTAAAALAAIGDPGIQVLFVHLGLPDRCGVTCAQEALALRPELRIVMISPTRDPLVIKRAYLAGAELCLIEPVTTAAWRETLSFLRHGWPQPSLKADLTPHSSPGPVHPLPSNAQTLPAHLSLREEEVLGCLDEGLFYKEAEARMGVSHSVFRKLQHRIFRKLGAQNRTEAVNHWRRLFEAQDRGTLD